MGPDVAAGCLAEFRKKALDARGADALNERLEALWAQLKREVEPFLIPSPQMQALLQSSGGPTNARELGLDPAFYREAVVGAREMRDRFSFLDIAADAGLLEDFAAAEG